MPDESREEGPGTKVLVIWLVVVFFLSLWLRFSPKEKTAPELESTLLISERLTLIANFSELSESTKVQLLEAAQALEKDPVKLRIIAGKQPPPEECEGLSSGFRELVTYRDKPGPESKARLEGMSQSAQSRFLVSLFLLTTLGLTALGGLLFGKAEPQEPSPLPSWSVFGFVGLFLAWDAFNTYGVGIAFVAFKGLLPRFWMILLSQAVAYGFLAVLIRLASKGWNPFKKFSWAWLGRGYALAVLVVLGTNLLVGALMGMPPRSQNPLLSLFAQCQPWQVVILTLLVTCVGPFFEELLFRGWLLGGLREHWGDGKALVVSAVLFALIHGDPFATPALFGLGMVFGWVYLRSGSLVACVMVHGMWNLTTFSFLLTGLP